MYHHNNTKVTKNIIFSNKNIQKLKNKKQTETTMEVQSLLPDLP